MIFSCVQDDSLQLNRVECDTFRSKKAAGEGGNSFTFRFCTNLNSGFTSHIGEPQRKVGKVIIELLASGHEFLGTKAFLVHTVRTTLAGNADQSTKILLEMMDGTPHIFQRRPWTPHAMDVG